MFFSDSLFIGIDPTSLNKSFTYVALDKGLNLIALSDGELDDVTAFVAGQQSALVAINAPSGLSRGVVGDKTKRDMLPSRKKRVSEFRLAEYELRQRGIKITGTPSNVNDCPTWVQNGFSLYRKLEKTGFTKYKQEESQTHSYIETNPQVCFSVLVSDAPLLKPTLEGKIQRQLALYERGVKIKDPMDFFEEITRHKMIKGIWHYELLYSPQQLNAMVAAYTAWLLINKPEQVISIGDEKEGKIFLPVK